MSSETEQIEKTEEKFGLDFHLEFELSDAQSVSVIAVDEQNPKLRKVIGNIFTPSGSGQDTKNAIQVCGIRDAFDFWGCSRFQTFATEEIGYVKKELPLFNFSDIDRLIFAELTPEQQERIRTKIFAHNEHVYQTYGKDDRVKIQLKDIQLLFPYPSESFPGSNELRFSRQCWGCFNTPCTCENIGNHHFKNPYEVKRESMVHTVKVKKEEGAK